jgi:uncharacterized protein
MMVKGGPSKIINPSFRSTEIADAPKQISEELFNKLLKFGGFPEPLDMGTTQFYHLWRSSRDQQLLREDVRDLVNVQQISQIESLAEFIRLQAGQLVSYTSFATKIGISIETVKRWLQVLKALYYCYEIRPWIKNISRSLIKGPKLYLWDWALLDNKGAKYENFIASHLKKALHYWTDRGFGTYQLHYLRTKDKREVDFLVSKNKEPWFIVEVKAAKENHLCKNLEYFQKKTGAKHAFQVVFSCKHQNINCFSYDYPIIVPATTFLSQLV